MGYSAAIRENRKGKTFMTHATLPADRIAAACEDKIKTLGNDKLVQRLHALKIMAESVEGRSPVVTIDLDDFVHLFQSYTPSEPFDYKTMMGDDPEH